MEDKRNEIKYDSWFIVLAMTLFWSLSYAFLRQIFKTRTPEFACRIISFFHGLIVSFFGMNQCFRIDVPFDHPEWRTTHHQKFIMVLSLGYFIHDLAWCFAHNTETKLMLAHHIYSVIALQTYLLKGYSGAQTTCALGSMEITNPALQLRWFLRTFGYMATGWFVAMDITFVLTFFIVRILCGTYFLIVVFKQPKNDWDMWFMALFIYVVSWLFLFNMCQYFMKKYRKSE